MYCGGLKLSLSPSHRLAPSLPPLIHHCRSGHTSEETCKELTHKLLFGNTTARRGTADDQRVYVRRASAPER